MSENYMNPNLDPTYIESKAHDVMQPALNVYQNYLVNSYKYQNVFNFFALYPGQWKAFATQTLRAWLEWSNGTVLRVHRAEQGTALIPSLLAPSIIKRTTDLVLSGGVRFTLEDLSRNDEGKRDLIEPTKFLQSFWAENTTFLNTVYTGVKYALEGGTSLIRINTDENGDLWTDSCRIDRFLPNFNAKGNLTGVKIYARVLSTTYAPLNSNENMKTNWVVVEERFYDKGKPKYRMCIEKEEGVVNSRAFSFTESKTEFKHLPKVVQEAFKQAYGKDTKVNAITDLPFRDLGCYVLKRTETSSVVPDIPFGDSLLVDAIPTLLSFDLAYTKMINDLYIGSSKVYIPGNINPRNAMGDGLNDSMLKITPMGDKGKLEFVQPDIRSNEWSSAFKNHYDMLSMETGVGTSYLFPNVGMQAQKTAKEISAEASMTTNTIENIRALIIPQINKILNEVMYFYGHEDYNAHISFSVAGLTNASLRYEESRMLYQANMISLHSALEMAFPEWSEDRILKEIQTRYDELDEMMKRGYDKKGARVGQDNHEVELKPISDFIEKPEEVKESFDFKRQKLDNESE